MMKKKQREDHKNKNLEAQKPKQKNTLNSNTEVLPLEKE